MVYVSIPVRDEERTLGVVLWKIRKVMSELGRDYEIVVLDDASTDRTADVLERYRRFLPLRVIRTPERIGYGAAVERLLRDAAERAPYPKRDVVVTLQGDFSEDPADMVPMIKAVEGGADLVAGRLEAGRNELPFRLRASRRLAGLFLQRSLRGAPVSDPLAGFRAYRVIVIRKAFRTDETGPTPPSGVWAANLFFLSRTAPHARRIDETPYRLRLEHRPRDSRFRPLGTLRGLATLRALSWPEPRGGTAS